MFVSVALAFFAASSAPSSEVPAATPTAAAPVKEKKICRSEEAVIGSLTSKRVCKTKGEWEGRTTAEGKTSTAKEAPVRRD